MSYFYFDESIRDNGKFMIGALVIADIELSSKIRNKWESIGLDPIVHEYKSSTNKSNSEKSNVQREHIKDLIGCTKVALVVLPNEDRGNLGNYCAKLIQQLLNSTLVSSGPHTLFVDDNIKIRNDYQFALKKLGFELHLKVDSAEVAGIQLADHASHALGGMLLEQMGLVRKRVKAGENSGYHPEEMLELGFELWASLRYSLVGKNTYIEGLSPHPDDPANPYFLVNGFGMFIAPTCSEYLQSSAKACFGINYLGCIH